MRPQAERQVKVRLALEKIASLENLEANEEDIAAEYENIAKMYSIEVDQVKASIPEDAIAEDMKVKKAMEFVKEKAVIKVKKPRKPRAPKVAPAVTEEPVAEETKSE